MHHGAGSSGLTFGLTARYIKELTRGECGVMAIDCRGHGASRVQNDDGDFSLETLTDDLIRIIQQTVDIHQEIILVGHSMGGAVVVNAACKKTLRNITGVTVLDVVEGSAIDALSSMTKILNSRPKTFTSVEQAILWSLQSKTVHTTESARLSIPALIERTEEGNYKWITDLVRTQPFWEKWFTGLSEKFLNTGAAKLLILAGTDRLDKPLIIGQMQGKFQLNIFPESGHFVQEDTPMKTAACLVEFWRRNRKLIIMEHAPSSIKSYEMKSYFGRKVAIDASMSIYQFMIAVRQQDGQLLQNEEGETTSHLMGMFYRTVRMVDNGLKPVYVFDGKPPMLKSGELAKRKARKEEAQLKMEEANEVGTKEDIHRFTKRTVRVTTVHNDECKQLLKLMGIPYVEAPCEAEAQCAELARSGKVFAAASEDMDTLTFKSPILLRHLTFSEARKMPIDEVHLDKVLEGLGFTMEQFVDLCILCGCDYTESIKGVGPKSAYTLIKEHKTIDEAINHLSAKQKENIPEDWKYAEARELFLKPEVTPGDQIEFNWNEPDVEGLVDFMVKKKGFSEERIRAGCEKLSRNLKKATQTRVQDFFKVLPSSSSKPDDKKRKNSKDAANAKKRKTKK
ncbi:PIN domain-like protein [Mycotypha africana]|uniref:PIN domain-like protein n=1 Tax=Mycotypha africana TaxID=64632 RepID=UPI0023007BBF|nr:PIN domain-like protein [Mycotypha africana]KAI8973340.1 PIN domain-like protein [Mycotypha africana]